MQVLSAEGQDRLFLDARIVRAGHGRFEANRCYAEREIMGQGMVVFWSIYV